MGKNGQSWRALSTTRSQPLVPLLVTAAGDAILLPDARVVREPRLYCASFAALLVREPLVSDRFQSVQLAPGDGYR